MIVRSKSETGTVYIRDATLTGCHWMVIIGGGAGKIFRPLAPINRAGSFPRNIAFLANWILSIQVDTK